MTVKRPQLNFLERLYVPAVAGGLKVTVSHFFRIRRKNGPCPKATAARLIW
jgi:hypothetical protein